MHIENLVKSLASFIEIVCVSLCECVNCLCQSTFLPVVDYGDVLYMCASSKSLAALDTVITLALRFFTGCGRLTHHCQLYSMSGWPSLSTRRETHWLLMIYKALLGMVPPYLCSLLRLTENRYALRSSDIYFFSISRVRTELGKKAFSYAAPLTWNNIQAELKLSELVSLDISTLSEIGPTTKITHLSGAFADQPCHLDLLLPALFVLTSIVTWPYLI